MNVNTLEFFQHGVRRALTIASIILAMTASAQTYTPSPITPGATYTTAPYHLTGLLIVPKKAAANVADLGSGAVVKHPRVVFSCAHLMFEKGQIDPWRTGARWYRTYAATAAPTTTGGQALRGYQSFSGYAAAAADSQQSAAALALDFVVHYAFENTADGAFAQAWDDGVSALKSTRTKLITGYPHGLYPVGNSQKFLMHRTGTFTRAFYGQNGDYLGIDEVATGPGNSGGPVWVHDGNTYNFAGVLIAGLSRALGHDEDFSGVFGVDASSTTLVDAAIRLAGGTTPTPTQAPTITTQPTSRRVNLGENVTFTVAGTGTALTYRWLFNGATLAGATTATLTLSSVTLAQAGTYQAVLSNSGGDTRSNSATLAVDLPPPVITTQPASQTVAAGASATFAVAATGTGTLTYQWSFTNSAGQTSVLAGGTAATLTLSAVQSAQAGSYSVTIRTAAGGSVTSRPATLTVTAPAGGGGTSGPANNAFAAATPLTGPTVSVTGTNVGATLETGEPPHTSAMGGASVWWTWTAPAAGTLTISTAGSSFDTILSVFTGTTLGALTRLIDDDDGGPGNSSVATLPVVTGTTYRIRVDGFGGATGSISLALTLQAAASAGASNDNFASRTALPAAGGTVTSTNVGATAESGEPFHAGLAAARSVWFTWTATTAGSVTLTTAGSNFDTRLAVYTGSAVGALTTVAGNDDAPGVTTSAVTFVATPGTAYQIAVDGFGSAAGSITLVLTPTAGAPVVPPPANDAFSQPAPIFEQGGAFSASSLGATKEPGEPEHANNRGGASVWWTWTAPASGTATVTTADSNFDTILAVYTGNALTALTAVAANDDTPTSSTSAVTFAVRAGETFRIAVDGYSGASGTVRLSLSLTLGVPAGPAAPPNDAFANRTPVTTLGVAASGANTGATRETGEPSHNGAVSARSVWWTWTPATAVNAVIATTNSDFDTILAVYSGATLNTLVPVASNDDTTSGVTTSTVRFAAAAGTAYQIAVDGKAGTQGSIRLVITTEATGPAAPANDAFANRSALPAAGGIIEGTIAGATRENGEPNHAGVAAARSVWYTWTPTRSGNATLNTSGSSFDSLLAVYEGAALGSLTEVASNDDTGGAKTSSVTFAVTAGTTYQIAVDGYPGGNSGTLRLAAAIAATPATSGFTQFTRLANLSVRSPAGSGASTLVVGFAIGGNSPKPILVRAIGPTLTGFNVPGAMADPVLTVYRGSVPIDGNDNWGASANAEDLAAKSTFVGAFPLNPTSRDAVVALNLLPGAYTAQISAAAGSANGVALLETYDTDFNADADATGRKLTNISSRAQVGTGADVMIAGFFVLGPTPKRVLVRGVGPSLAAFGVTGVLADPQIAVRRGTVTVGANDNWSGAAVSAAAATSGAFPLPEGSRDAALVAALEPGAYTVELSGVGNGTGVGLIEIYELP